MNMRILFLLLLFNYSSSIPMELSNIKRNLSLYTREMRMQYHDNPECCKLLAGTVGAEIACSCLACGPWGSLCLNTLLGGSFLAMYHASHESDERRRIRNKRDQLEQAISWEWITKEQKEAGFQQDAFLESDPDSLRTQNTPILIHALTEYENTSKRCDELTKKLETSKHTLTVLRHYLKQKGTDQEKNKASLLFAEAEFNENSAELDLRKKRVLKITDSLALLKKYHADLNEATMHFQRYSNAEYTWTKAWLLAENHH